MTKTELRVHALRMAIDTTGNSNKVQLAGEYLAFLSADEAKQEPQAKQGKQK